MENLELSSVLSTAQDLMIYNWANQTGYQIVGDGIVKARETFYALPYSERRKYYVRPKAYGPSDEDMSPAAIRKAISAYKASGDAVHAIKAVGIEMESTWIDQKRNSQGIVEILNSDLFDRDESGEFTPVEYLESQARDSGLYDATQHQQLPEPVEDQAAALSCADSLLAVARQRLPEASFGMFLAVEVDGQSLRDVAKEFGVSYRQVWQTLDLVRNTLRGIATTEDSDMKSA
jgi:DNA-directed RNA polymerase specialized sigma24 family protein